MAHFLITSKSVPKFQVRLADTDRVHAGSVLMSLLEDLGCPDDLTLAECKTLYGQARRWWAFWR